MTTTAILGMSLAMLLLAATPGPGVLAVVGRALAGGWRPGLVMVAGIVAGDLVFLFAAVLGLAALAEALGDLFVVVRWAGGVYLVWLGIRAWRAPPVRRPAATEDRASPGRSDGNSGSPWAGSWGGAMSGLLLTLGNPKVILFYLGFLPTFVDVTALDAGDLLILAVVVSTVLGGVLSLYTVLAGWARNWFESEPAQRRLNRAAGAVMIATGGVLIARSQ